MKVKTSLIFLFVVACGQNQGNIEQRFQAADVMSYNSEEAFPIAIEEGKVLAAALSIEDIKASKIIASEGALPAYIPQGQSGSVAPAPTTQAPAPATQAPAPTTQAPAPTAPVSVPQSPKLPAETMAKVASCYSQWDSLSQLKNQAFSVREYNLDVGRLRKTTIEIGGTEPEIVFVKISSATRIAKVNIGLMNPKALYCVDIDAARVINKLAVFNRCGSTVGVLEIDAGRRARNIEIREICK